MYSSRLNLVDKVVLSDTDTIPFAMRPQKKQVDIILNTYKTTIIVLKGGLRGHYNYS